MIDEKKLIEDIDNCVVGLTNIQMMQIADIVETQPKVGEWIPVSDRLPECDWGFENTEGLLFQLESGAIEAGFYGTGGKYRDRYFRPYRSNSEGFDVKDIVAWMPLPEPYKE